MLAECQYKGLRQLREPQGAADYPAAWAFQTSPLVAEETCLMCHNFPSVTCLNAHFQTLFPPGGIICCNVGVRNPGVVQLVIWLILFLPFLFFEPKNPGNGNVFRKTNLLWKKTNWEIWLFLIKSEAGMIWAIRLWRGWGSGIHEYIVIVVHSDCK